MKKLHALAFYALITPAIALGSTALLASHHSGENKDLGEQDMDNHAKSGKQASEHHEEAKKSKYNEANTTGQDDSEMSDQSGMKNKDEMESSSMSAEE